jgi:tagatose 6-phosphate kinase
VIVVLSLNTALDRTLVVPGFTAGRVQRAERSLLFAGGKGLNVARVVRALGLPVRVVGFLGGMPAPYIRMRCDELGIEQRWVETEEDSRTCVILVDPEKRAETVVNEAGPWIGPVLLERLRATLRDTVGAGDILSLSGSAPPGVPDALYLEVVEEIQARGARVLVDAAAAALRAALDASPWAVTPNAEEAAAALGDADPPDLARRLARHASHVILTLGSSGALYAHGDRVERVPAPQITCVNAVGSGDALVAGFLAGVECGMAPREAVRLGMACGASNAARLEPGIGSRVEVERLLAGMGGGGPGEERLPAR